MSLRAKDLEAPQGSGTAVLASRQGGAEAGGLATEHLSELVARSRELGVVAQAMEKAGAGAGAGAVLLLGEPGTGKTAIVERALRMAADWRVELHRLSDRREAAVRDGDSLARALRSALHWSDPGGVQDTPCGSSGESAQASQVHPSLMKAIREWAKRADRPLLLAVDDCDRLCAPGWAALVELADQLASESIVMILSWTLLPWTGPPDAGETMSVLSLGSLTPAQAERVLEAHGLPIPSPEVLGTIMSGTGGIPLGLVDVVERLSSEELAGWHAVPAPLPLGPRMTAAFSQVTAVLEKRTLEALTALAVARHPLPVIEQALSLLGASANDLEPARRAGVITLSGERVEFCHPLVAAALFEAATPDLREAACRAVAVATAGAPEPTQEHLLSVTRQVAGPASPRERDAAFQELLAVSSESPDEACRRYLSAARLRLAHGSRSRAETLLEKAAKLAGSPAEQAAVASERARLRLAGDIGLGAREELADASAIIEPFDGDLALMTLCELAACEALSGASTPRPVLVALSHMARRCGPEARHVADLASAVFGGPVGFDQTDRIDDALDGISASAPENMLSPSFVVALGLGLLARPDGQERGQRLTEWLSKREMAEADGPLAAARRTVEAAQAIRGGELVEARALAVEAVHLAVISEQPLVDALATSVLIEAEAAAGVDPASFGMTAKLFAFDPAALPFAMPNAVAALADLMLARGHVAMAMRWVDTVVAGSPGEASFASEASPARGLLAPVAAEAFVLGARRASARELLVASAEQRPLSTACLSSSPGWASRVQGMLCDDLDEGVALFEVAMTEATGAPLAAARTRLRQGQYLRDAGEPLRALPHLEEAATALRELGARNWAAQAEQAFEETRRSLPAHVSEVAPGHSHAVPASPRERGGQVLVGRSGTSEAEFTLKMLGTFSMQHQKEELVCPQGRPAEVLKIVALRKQILVDELVELLWPEAAFGVGNRRLRNVLWRIRLNVGEVVRREGNFLRLGPNVEVDVDVFRALARSALDSTTPAPEALRLAFDALELYAGPLLLEDMYADWAAADRESLSRLSILLLEMLAREAVDTGRRPEALLLLERLIEADPYEERHYVEAARLEAASGRRHEALSWLLRADTVRTNLGLSPSHEVASVRRLVEHGDAARAL